MRRAFELLALLGDRAEHSGAELAAALGITRAAVWNQIRRLRAEGIEIPATSRGYALLRGFDALDADAIRSHLHALGCAAWTDVATLMVTDSTNERLLRAQDEAEIHGHVLLAEYQTAGRGRRGDRWISPPGSGLCFSAAWRFDTPPPTFSALSLVVGLALVRSLQAAGIGEARLKWPNDIVRGAGKLAGILIEMRAEAGGPCCAVIGVGLNIALSPTARARIDRPSDDVVNASGAEVARNPLAARLLADLAVALGQFAEHGFAPFRADWLAQDALAGRTVTLDLGHRVVTGRASGVDDYGALLIEQDGVYERFLSGHLTAA
jgi:BirA family transcriptional regulator, biotin operon repressor / biotin---[acetyl-CoA-carboxylase] ligase